MPEPTDDRNECPLGDNGPCSCPCCDCAPKEFTAYLSGSAGDCNECPVLSSEEFLREMEKQAKNSQPTKFTMHFDGTLIGTFPIADMPEILQKAITWAAPK
jgi:hypothetical protein